MNGAIGTFTHFVHDPDDSTSLSGEGVLTMHEDRSGALWVGTEAEWFTAYRHDPGDPGSLGTNRLSRVLRSVALLFSVRGWE